MIHDEGSPFVSSHHSAVKAASDRKVCPVRVIGIVQDSGLRGMEASLA